MTLLCYSQTMLEASPENCEKIPAGPVLRTFYTRLPQLPSGEK
jgi:hypothetical protein